VGKGRMILFLFNIFEACATNLDYKYELEIELDSETSSHKRGILAIFLLKSIEFVE